MNLLDSDFQAIVLANNMTNLYVGFPAGNIMMLPAFNWAYKSANQQGCSEPGSCPDFDPRFRPWYVAASSGPKNVILIIDTSGSMREFNRLAIAKSAAITVINTLDHGDFVAVIAFNTRAGIIGSGNIVRATTANRAALVAAVNQLVAAGETNFEQGFKLAFDALDSAFTDSKKHSGCNTAILFLTDGTPTAGDNVVPLIAERNTPDMDARIFTYSLGEQASKTIPKQIACENQGIWTEVSDGGDLRGVMGSFYLYFTQGLQDSTVSWSEIYTDCCGLGEVTTAAFACFDPEGRRPVAVVGADIPISKLGDTTKAELRELSETCYSFNLTPDEIEAMRRAVSQDSVCDTTPNTNLSAGALAGIIVGSVVGGTVIILTIIYVCIRVSRARPTEGSEYDTNPYPTSQ